MKRSALILVLTMLAACVDGPSALDEGRACALREALSLRVGEVFRDPEAGGSFCVDAPDGGTYVLIPFLSGPRDTLARVLVSVQGSGLAIAPLTVQSTAPTALLEASPPSEVDALLDGNAAWHAAFNRRVDGESAALLRSARPDGSR